jgi:glycosyltransferase involved in cell wall biosynthesis
MTRVIANDAVRSRDGLTGKRLLYLTQYYATPEQAGPTRHYQHVGYLLKKGYQVYLITSYVKNRDRMIPDAYRHKKIAVERNGNLTICKTYAYPNYGADIGTRLLNYLSFALLATLAGLKALRCDIVLASSPPLFAGAAGYLLSRLKHAKLVFEVRDLWPESAVAMGSLHNKWLIWLSHCLADFLYRKSDKIIALTAGIKQGIEARHVPGTRIELITNGVDDEFLTNIPAEQVQGLREQFDWTNKFVVLYAGTLSRSNNIETLIRAAAELVHSPDIKIVLVGNGEAKQALIDLKQTLGLANVTILPSEPKQRMPELVQAADICALQLRSDHFFHGTLGNKVFDYMGAGRAIVAAIPPGELQDLIEKSQAGIVVEPENPQAMAQAILRLKSDSKLREQMGRSAQEYVRRNYIRSQLAYRLLLVLEEIGGRKKPRVRQETPISMSR